MLEKIGYKVEIAKDGKEAEEMYMNNPSGYFCILLDYEMPHQNGLETMIKIRKDNLHIPIFLLTAHSNESDRKDCKNAGGNGFLTKPISIQTLKGVLGSLLSSKGNKSENLFSKQEI